MFRRFATASTTPARSNTLRIVLACICTLAAVGGCTALKVSELDQRYGAPDPARYDRPAVGGTIDFQTQVKPILDHRCAVCHACYDAACQLKLSSFEGLARGATSARVYNAERALAAPPTRLFEDADSFAAWREMGFSPVLNERADTPNANIEGSVLAQMLLLKQRHPLPQGPVLPDTFDFALNRDEQCTDIEGFDAFAADYPLWGMPYGLPGLTPQEQRTVLQWLEQGAPFAPPDRMSPELTAEIADWETFFNQSSTQARLAVRYIYEHLFQAHLYFPAEAAPAQGGPTFFELVRSTTPPGQPVQRISTRVPFADPGNVPIFYRLLPVRETISRKNHMPYRLDEARMARWRELFLNDSYTVTSLPSYDPKTASNPFVTFRQLPVKSRYQFMLDEAQFTIMGFIKGPVCRGQTALNVINDHFWVFFADPDRELSPASNPALEQALESLAMPAAARSTAAPLKWLAYAKQEKRYRDLRDQLLDEANASEVPLNLEIVWDGDGDNDNAALTVFRHFDSASVVKGLLGGAPQTAWGIDYPLLERIHYLLVAGYDVYGNLGHQLNTRIYMDFLRMEGESNFIALLPADKRADIRREWYRGDVSPLVPYLHQQDARIKRESTVPYETDTPLPELYQRLQARLGPVLSDEHELDPGRYPEEVGRLLAHIDASSGAHLTLLPETTFLILDQPDGEPLPFTLIHHRAHSNISYLFGEADRRLPLEDTLTLAPGFVGAYPNALLRVRNEQLGDFADQLDALLTEADYQTLLNRYGVRRSNPEFWAMSDLLHHLLLTAHPVSGGLLDYNRLENR